MVLGVLYKYRTKQAVDFILIKLSAFRCDHRDKKHRVFVGDSISVLNRTPIFNFTTNKKRLLDQLAYNTYFERQLFKTLLIRQNSNRMDRF